MREFVIKLSDSHISKLEQMGINTNDLDYELNKMIRGFIENEEKNNYLNNDRYFKYKMKKVNESEKRCLMLANKSIIDKGIDISKCKPFFNTISKKSDVDIWYKELNFTKKVKVSNYSYRLKLIGSTNPIKHIIKLNNILLLEYDTSNERIVLTIYENLEDVDFENLIE